MAAVCGPSLRMAESLVSCGDCKCGRGIYHRGRRDRNAKDTEKSRGIRRGKGILWLRCADLRSGWQRRRLVAEIAKVEAGFITEVAEIGTQRTQRRAEASGEEEGSFGCGVRKARAFATPGAQGRQNDRFVVGDRTAEGERLRPFARKNAGSG